jgi:ribosome recycling factor
VIGKVEQGEACRLKSAYHRLRMDIRNQLKPAQKDQEVFEKASRSFLEKIKKFLSKDRDVFLSVNSSLITHHSSLSVV